MAGFNAWSEIHHGGDDGNVTKIMPGDAVSAGDVGLEDDEFKKEYVDTGVVRQVEYPVPENVTDQSPTEFYKEQLAALASPEVDQQAYAEALQTVQGNTPFGEQPAAAEEAAASEPAPAKAEAERK
jgi:hypothetical protein